MSKNKYISVEKLFNMTLFNDEFYREWVTQDIKDEIDEYNGSIVMIDDQLFCNTDGCREILDTINRDEDEYIGALLYISKNDKSDIPVDTEIIGAIKNENVDEEILKRYIRRVCLGISTNGKCLSDDELDMLYARDKKTINQSFKIYNDSVKAGHCKNSVNLPKVYDYINNEDPDICKRMLYYYEYDPIELGDFLDRFNYMDYKAIRKAITKSFRKDKKKHEKKNKKYRK